MNSFISGESLNKSTKKDLVAFCKNLNLRTSGRKDELIQRILDSDRSEAPSLSNANLAYDAVISFQMNQNNIRHPKVSPSRGIGVAEHVSPSREYSSAALIQDNSKYALSNQSPLNNKTECFCTTDIPQKLLKANSITCIECNIQCHIKCHGGNEALGPIAAAYMCSRCRVCLIDPFFPVEEILCNGVLPSHRFEYKLEAPLLKQWKNENKELFITCMKLDKKELHHDWPELLTIYINGKPEAEIQPPAWEHKRRDVPFRFTHLVKLGKNTITVKWKNSEKQPGLFALSITLRRTLTPDLIAKEICERQLVPCEVAKDRVKYLVSKRHEDDDIQCMELSHRMKLICPITFTRIETACRGRYCRHLQCFDLKGFLLVMKNTKAFNMRWRCPECQLNIRPRDLVVDGYAMYLLATASELATVLEIREDASFRVISAGELKQEAMTARGEIPPASDVRTEGPAKGDDDRDSLLEHETKAAPFETLMLGGSQKQLRKSPEIVDIDDDDSEGDALPPVPLIPVRHYAGESIASPLPSPTAISIGPADFARKISSSSSTSLPPHSAYEGTPTEKGMRQLSAQSDVASSKDVASPRAKSYSQKRHSAAFSASEMPNLFEEEEREARYQMSSSTSPPVSPSIPPSQEEPPLSRHHSVLKDSVGEQQKDPSECDHSGHHDRKASSTSGLPLLSQEKMNLEGRASHNKFHINVGTAVHSLSMEASKSSSLKEGERAGSVDLMHTHESLKANFGGSLHRSESAQHMAASRSERENELMTRKDEDSFILPNDSLGGISAKPLSDRTSATISEIICLSDSDESDAPSPRKQDTSIVSNEIVDGHEESGDASNSAINLLTSSVIQKQHGAQKFFSPLKDAENESINSIQENSDRLRKSVPQNREAFRHPESLYEFEENTAAVQSSDKSGATTSLQAGVSQNFHTLRSAFNDFPLFSCTAESTTPVNGVSNTVFPCDGPDALKLPVFMSSDSCSTQAAHIMMNSPLPKGPCRELVPWKVFLPPRIPQQLRSSYVSNGDTTPSTFDCFSPDQLIRSSGEPRTGLRSDDFIVGYDANLQTGTGSMDSMPIMSSDEDDKLHSGLPRGSEGSTSNFMLRENDGKFFGQLPMHSKMRNTPFRDLNYFRPPGQRVSPELVPELNYSPLPSGNSKSMSSAATLAANVGGKNDLASASSGGNEAAAWRRYFNIPRFLPSFSSRPLQHQFSVSNNITSSSSSDKSLSKDSPIHNEDHYSALPESPVLEDSHAALGFGHSNCIQNSESMAGMKRKRSVSPDQEWRSTDILSEPAP